MRKHEEKTLEPENLKDEFLDFEIEKTHKSLFEAGKSLGTSFLTHLSLLFVTALLAYGTNAEEGISLPLIDLKVNRGLATAITLLLTYIVQIWVISLFVLTTSLSNLLDDLQMKRYGRNSLDTWHRDYPSPVHSLLFLLNILPGKQSVAVRWLVTLGYSNVVTLLPYYLFTVVSSSPDFPAEWKGFWETVFTILNFSVMISTFGVAAYIWKINHPVDSHSMKKNDRSLEE